MEALNFLDVNNKDAFRMATHIHIGYILIYFFNLIFIKLLYYLLPDNYIYLYFPRPVFFN